MGWITHAIAGLALASLVACGTVTAERRGSQGTGSADDPGRPVPTVVPAALAPQSLAPGPVRAAPAGLARLQTELDAIKADIDFPFGLVVEHLESGERYAHAAETPFFSGSVYKAAVAYEVLRRVDDGETSLGWSVTIEPEDATEGEPAGGPAIGEEVTVREALESMMGVSSNAAAYALMRLVGRDQLNASLNALGLERTSVPLKPGDRPGPESAPLHPSYAVTSAEDMALLLRLLAGDRLLSREGCAELRRLFALREELDPIAHDLHQDIEVLSKVGNLEDASNVAALVPTESGPVIVVFLSEDTGPSAAREAIEQVAEAVFRLYGRPIR